MIARSCHVLFATFILFIIHTNTSPTQPLNSTILAVKSTTTCFESGSQLADVRDCIQAILLLPEGADTGVFHEGAPNDVFQIPKEETYRSCMATASLTRGISDQSSWDHIAFAASQMLVLCASGAYPHGRTGGAVYVGLRGGIRVTVERAAQNALSGGNGTATS